MRVRRSVLRLLLAGLVPAGLLLTGCGSDTGPADQVPELAARLDRVDAAVADSDYAQARTALKALAATTDRAEAEGDLSTDEASRIDDAVTALLDDLPDATPTEEPSPSETPDETTPSDPETSESTAPEETSPPSEPAKEPKPPKHEKEKEKGGHKGKGH